MLKNQKGITLVALVITIIVLLILAGVSISLVIGNNGILNQATNATSESIEAEFKHAVALAGLATRIEYTTGTYANAEAAYTAKFETELAQLGYTVASVPTTTAADIVVTRTSDSEVFTLNLQVTTDGDLLVKDKVATN